MYFYKWTDILNGPSQTRSKATNTLQVLPLWAVTIATETRINIKDSDVQNDKVGLHLKIKVLQKVLQAMP